MKKIISLFLLSILFISCGNDDDNSDDTVVIDHELNYMYLSLKEGTDGYMYYESTASFNYYYSDVISYEILNVVGEYGIKSHKKFTENPPHLHQNRLKMKYVFNMTVDQFNEIKSKPDYNSNEVFIKFTLRLTLKEDYTEL